MKEQAPTSKAILASRIAALGLFSLTKTLAENENVSLLSQKRQDSTNLIHITLQIYNTSSCIEYC